MNVGCIFFFSRSSLESEESVFISLFVLSALFLNIDLYMLIHKGPTEFNLMVSGQIQETKLELINKFKKLGICSAL